MRKLSVLFVAVTVLGLFATSCTSVETPSDWVEPDVKIMANFEITQDSLDNFFLSNLGVFKSHSRLSGNTIDASLTKIQRVVEPCTDRDFLEIILCSYGNKVNVIGRVNVVGKDLSRPTTFSNVTFIGGTEAEAVTQKSHIYDASENDFDERGLCNDETTKSKNSALKMLAFIGGGLMLLLILIAILSFVAARSGSRSLNILQRIQFRLTQPHSEA